jgi:hypothetical protein
MKDIYVAVNGSDDGEGTIDSPFRTLEKARDYACKYVSEENGINIILRAGCYEMESTFEILKEHMGSENCPIRYLAYNKEEVIISGGTTLDGSKFRKVSDEAILERLPEEARPFVLCYDLKEDGLYEYGVKRNRGFALDIVPADMELFIDNKAMEVAGWPNHGRRVQVGEVISPARLGELDIGKELLDPENPGQYKKYDLSDYKGGIIKYDYERADRWGKAKDAFAFGYMGWGFSDNNFPIEFIDTENKTIHFKCPSVTGISNHAYYNTYRVYNLLEEIDVPGEYYIDKEAGILYLYPPAGFSENSTVQVSIMEEPLIAMEDAKYINIQGITFENSRGMAIYSQGCENTTITDCVFRNLGMVAISFGLGFEDTPIFVHSAELLPVKRKIGGIKAHMWDNQFFNRQGGHNNTVIGCQVYNTGCGGLILDGGDRYHLVPGNNKVVDCDIHDFNRIDTTYRPGVKVLGMANSVSFCKIYNCPQQAIEFTGNDHVIEYNEIFNACTDNYDNGAIYSGSRHNSVNSTGCVVRYNYFHDNGANNHFMFGKIRSETYDLYLDGQPCTLVYGNIFASSNSVTGTFFNMHCHYCIGENNMYINSNGFYHYHMYDEDFSYNPFAFFDEETAEKWETQIPILKTYLNAREIPYAGNEIVSNIHVGSGHFLRGSETVYKFKNNVHFDEDPGFEDMENGNFALRPDSIVFSKVPGFTRIPFEYIANYSKYIEDNK